MQKELQLQFGPTNKWGQHFSKRNLVHTARTLAPTLAALVFASAAHAQGTMDFTGATTLMTTFKTLFPLGRETLVGRLRLVVGI